MSEEDKEYIEELKKSKELIGYLHPCIRSKISGKLVSGEHRKEADPNWPENVRNLTEKEELLIIIGSNVQRTIPTEEKQEWVTKARKILQSEGKKGTQEEIAKLLGKSQNWVSKYDTSTIQPHSKKQTQLPSQKTSTYSTAITFLPAKPLGIVKSPQLKTIEELPEKLTIEFVKEKPTSLKSPAKPQPTIYAPSYYTELINRMHNLLTNELPQKVTVLNFGISSDKIQIFREIVQYETLDYITKKLEELDKILTNIINALPDELKSR